MSTKALVGILIAGTVGVLIFLFVHPSSSSNTISIGSQSAGACTNGDKDCLPNVNYVDTTGKAYTPESLKGKVVVVNFWGTFCPPCKKEIPAFSRAYDKFKSKGVVFLGVLADSDNVDDSQLLNFASDFDMTYPIVRMSSDINVSFKYPNRLPTTFVFDRNGKQVLSQVGALSDSQLDALLDQLTSA